MEEDTSLVWRNVFYLDSLNINDSPRHLISMEEIQISMREIQICMQEIQISMREIQICMQEIKHGAYLQ